MWLVTTALATFGPGMFFEPHRSLWPPYSSTWAWVSHSGPTLTAECRFAGDWTDYLASVNL